MKRKKWDVIETPGWLAGNQTTAWAIMIVLGMIAIMVGLRLVG